MKVKRLWYETEDCQETLSRVRGNREEAAKGENVRVLRHYVSTHVMVERIQAPDPWYHFVRSIRTRLSDVKAGSLR